MSWVPLLDEIFALSFELENDGEDNPNVNPEWKRERNMEVHSAVKVNRNNDKSQECDTEQRKITQEHMLHDSTCYGSATGTSGFYGSGGRHRWWNSRGEKAVSIIELRMEITSGMGAGWGTGWGSALRAAKVLLRLCLNLYGGPKAFG